MTTVAHQRLSNLHVARPAVSPADVVHHLGAVQAQDYPASLWAIGLRVRAAEQDTVERAITDRSTVRTWPMRGTLHWVAADDIRWLLQLLTPRVIRASASRHRQLELDARVFTRARRLLERALHGGRALTRPAVHALLQKDAVDVMLTPFRPLKKRELAGARAAATRYGAFLGVRAELEIDE